MTKGADSVIYDQCLSDVSKNSDVYKSTQDHVNDYANEGLRTLFLAEKTIDEQTYQRWNKRVTAAKEQGQGELVDDINGEIEKNLELIGSTAIEDKL